MFHSRQLHHKIDKIQERALRVTYQDYESSFEVLMEKDRSRGGGVTPIRGMVYMCLPGLWVNLRYFARVMGHVL